MSTTMQIGSEQAVEDLLAIVKRLPPGKLREFARQFASWHRPQDAPDAQEVALIQAARMRLPRTEARRLAQLVARSEEGMLTAEELSEYQSLACRAEGIDALRAQALAELVQRWRKPVEAVMDEIGWGSASDAA